MKKLLSICLALIFAAMIFMSGCARDNGGDDDDDDLITAKNIDQSACGGISDTKKADDDEETYNEKLQVTYDGETLTIAHQNAQAGCGQQIYVEYRPVTDEIEIYEEQKSEPAFCGSCCYQLQYAVPNIENKSYALIVTEVNWEGEEKVLADDTIDLSASDTYDFLIGEAACP
jgi:hypothetical protein